MSSMAGGYGNIQKIIEPFLLVAAWGIIVANALHPIYGRVKAFAARLAGSRGPEFASLSSVTIRNVAIGIVGVSIIQTVSISTGFLVMEIPAAGQLDTKQTER
jgi:predicted PurR-regulated permease PerM